MGADVWRSGQGVGAKLTEQSEIQLGAFGCEPSSMLSDAGVRRGAECSKSAWGVLGSEGGPGDEQEMDTFSKDVNGAA